MGAVEDDPDPTEYLYVSLETKRKDQTKPYDGKKMVWVPDPKDGFLLGEIKSTKGEQVTVDVPGGEVRVFLPSSAMGHMVSTVTLLDFAHNLINNNYWYLTK